MPIYEYQCGECGYRLEALQKLSEEPLVDCPECARPALTRLISAAGFRLKGKGWYETDFKQGNRRNVADSDKGGGTSGDGGAQSTGGASDSGGSKSDSKPSSDAAAG